MKIVCYILSIYLIFAIGIACPGTVPIDNNIDNISVVNSNNTTHDQEGPYGSDDCPPLCVCHCCHMHVVLSYPIEFKHPEKLPVLYSSYFQDFRSIEISDFLKPPK
ncbi:DUF6660 family protein [Algoriphagus sp.]|uniref:DUF6660 family protein n=1 Tax=Algoriphagus sp. TaxID=1872435 RepID=UPI003F70DF46